MSALIVRQLRDYLNTITDEDDLDAPVVLPMRTDMPHLFAFEEACPGVSEMVTLGPAPIYMPDGRQDGSTMEMRALLIAPHGFHEEDKHEETKKTLN